MTIAIVAIGTRGTLGHATSASEIAESLVGRGGIDVRLLVDSALEPFLYGSSPVTAVQPPIVRSASVGGSAQSGYTAQLLRFHHRHRPSAYIFDTFYDIQFLDLLASEGVPRVLISYRYRDAARAEFEVEARSRFSRVYWYYEPYELVGSTCPERVGPGEFIGPPLLSVMRRARRSPPRVGKREVLLTCGGGGRPGSRVAYAEMLNQLNRMPEVETIAIPGPFFRGGRQGHTVSRDRLLEAMQRSDLVVCEAGYFTTLEVACFAERALLVPGPRRIDDQEQRAASMSDRPGFGCVLPRDLGRSFRPIVRNLLGSEVELSTRPDWNPMHAIHVVLDGLPLVSAP